jgi:hypothetical protein
MQHTIGAEIEKVVSKPSPFGRGLVEAGRPIVLARTVQCQAVPDRLARSNPKKSATRGKATAPKQ